MQGSVAVFVLRHTGGSTEILAQEAPGGGLTLPRTLLSDQEHPCEAAWRSARDGTGQDSFRTFRRLGKVNGCYVFQTAADTNVDGALCSAGLAWVPAAVARARLIEPWQTLFPALD